MQQITFTAGYGDPNRTIQQKYSDYDKIDELMTQLRTENAGLEAQISGLETEKASLITTLNTVPGIDEEAIREKIQNINAQINSLRDKIEENRDTGRKAWYGFHERY